MMLAQGREVPSFVAELDTDQDGKLSLEEILADMGPVSSDRTEIVAAFNRADKDGDGLLDAAEAETFMKLVKKLPGSEFEFLWLDLTAFRDSQEFHNMR
eukprot:CAMPEP_0194496478 /NCGR_PEP_ID=MMETSP0253-20130528/13740_1 /TAXON_ID=2966 /ORGANISM="Noctiluca scintillans" /LENGTH=98 /DNA_ID=CAMNT_0039337875 /DNA_START=71 /DNA_END=365 /DNA_ORIENTATION=-